MPDFHPAETTRNTACIMPCDDLKKDNPYHLFLFLTPPRPGNLRQPGSE